MRYELRDAGVWDKVAERLILPTDPAWADYEAALYDSPPDPKPLSPLPPIAARRTEIAAQVNAVRNRVLNRLTVTIGGYVVAADTASYANLLGIGLLLATGEPLPAGFTWRTVDNQLVPLTAAQVRAVLKAMVQAREAAYRRSWALKDDEIAASEAPDGVDLEAGWPA